MNQRAARYLRKTADFTPSITREYQMRHLGSRSARQYRIKPDGTVDTRRVAEECFMIVCTDSRRNLYKDLKRCFKKSKNLSADFLLDQALTFRFGHN